MSDLTDFLLARIAEEEAVAREAVQDERQLAEDYSLVAGTNGAVEVGPARVLAECEAKREIVEHRQRIDRNASDTEWHSGYSDGNYDALRALALPYADHEDYRKEWRA